MWGFSLGVAPRSTRITSGRIVGPDRDKEERVENVFSSIPVHPQEHEIGQPRDWVRPSHEAAQKRVEPSSIPKVVQEGVPIGAGKSEPDRQSPYETVGESAGPEDLRHRPKHLTAPGVGHGFRRPMLPAAVGVVGGRGGVRRYQGCLSWILARVGACSNMIAWIPP